MSIKKTLEKKFKKTENKVKKEIEKKTNKIKNFPKKAKEKLKDLSVGDAKFAPLIPLVPAMSLAIKAKGVKPEPPTHIKALAFQFGRVVLGIKPQNFDFEGARKEAENTQSDSVAVETIATGLNVAQGAAKAYAGDPSGIKLLIQSILNYFKFLKKKKESGKKLSKTEEDILNTAEKAADEIKDYAKGEVGETLKELSVPLLIIVIALFVLK